MAIVYTQRIIDGVLQELQNKEGTERYNAERNESNLKRLLQQSLIELSMDSRQFQANVGIRLNDSHLPEAINVGNDWTDLGGGGVVSGSSFHELSDPPRYLNLRSIIYNHVPVVDVAELDRVNAGIQPVYERLQGGFRFAQYDSSVDAFDPLNVNYPLQMTYYTWPDINQQDYFEGHQLSELALTHLMLHHLQSRDPFIEFDNNQLNPGQFNHASWQYQSYIKLAKRIEELVYGPDRAQTTTIKPFYF